MERNSFGQESERDTKFYRFIFDSVHDPILVIRTSGRIIDANQALTDALGYSKEELLCMNIMDLRAPGEKGRTNEDLEKSYDGCVFESVYKRKDSSVFPVEISVRGAMLGGEKALFGIVRDITKRKQTECRLKQMEWLLTKHYEEIPAEEEAWAPYGDLTGLNRNGLILRSVGKEVLRDIVEDYLDLLDTSAAIYEKNGDYAYGIFTSGWCRLMDSSSRQLCGTEDNVEALRSGKWLCHESCWSNASRVSMETARPTDIACSGGLRLFAVPIYAGGEVIGSINFGYGDPPKDTATLEMLAGKFHVTVEELIEQGKLYQTRPQYIIDLAKQRLQTSARIIGMIVERKQADEALQQALRQLKAETGCISAVVRAEAEEKLLSRVCHIIVEAGGYRMAWIGKKEPEFRVRPVTSYGIDEGYLASIHVTWDDSKYGMGPTGMAIKTGKAQVMKDVPGTPAYEPWAKDAQARGYTSSIALPLIADEGVIGALNVYSADANAFTEGEVKLLQDITANLAFGIQSLRQRQVRREAEEALRESEEKFRTLADASPAAIIVYQGNRQRYANATAIATFGYTEQELLSMNFLGLIHPDHRAMVERIVTSRMQGEQKPARYEVKVLTKDREEKWLDISSRLISYEGSRAGIVICTDITERKQAEEELKIAKEQAELYLDLMSHDISNMHQIMLMQLEMAKDILDTEGSIEKNCEEVITGPIQALQRSASLIQSVRKIQQVSSGNYRPELIDIGMVLQGVVREYSSVPGRDVKIQYTSRDGYCVRANHMIKDVFTNIVDNAVKHSKDPVVIDLSVDGVEENGQSYCRVTIADNGNGVSDDRKEQIFHRLKGGRTIERGTGLGLYIVKTLVQSFGGSIWVEDRVPGDYTRGAKFIVMLPVDDE